MYYNRSKRGRRRDNQQQESIFQIYHLSYKKNKYWLAVFTIIAIVVYLIYSKYEFWNVIVDLPQIKRKAEFARTLGQFKKIPAKTRIGDAIVAALIYDAKTSPWRRIHNESDKYLQLTRSFLDSLNSMSGVYSDAVINELIKRDSVLIFRKIAQRDSTISRRIRMGIDFSPKEVLDEKEQFRKEVNDSLQSYHARFITDKFKSNVYRDYQIGANDLDMTLEQLLTKEEEYKKKMKNLEEYLEHEEVRATAANISTSNKNILFFSLPALAIVAFYLMILYLNFKYYESLVESVDRSIAVRMPTVRNILNHFDIKLPKVVPIILNLAAPFLALVFLLYLMRFFLLNYLPLMIAMLTIGGIYIAGASLLILKTRKFVWKK